MRICVIGAGKMGTWITDALCLNHEVAIYDQDMSRLRYVFNTLRFTKPEEITNFNPEILINAVSLKHTLQAFKDLLPYIPKACILSDIASVKTGFYEFYEQSGRRYVSTHPMFGPTFANLNDLSQHHAIIINEGDQDGINFFRGFYKSLGLNIHDYSFDGHDETIAYSLSVPFASSLVFAGCMKHQKAPGTTFNKHMTIARGLLSEEDHLLTEILFNPFTYSQVEKIRLHLKELLGLIKEKDSKGMQEFLNQVRNNIAEN